VAVATQARFDAGDTASGEGDGWSIRPRPDAQRIPVLRHDHSHGAAARPKRETHALAWVDLEGVLRGDGRREHPESNQQQRGVAHSNLRS